MAQDALKDITEFFENDIGESIIGRNDSLASFRELGPPDLCHIIKTNNKVSTRDIGSYHFVLGTDTSSSATIAAYLNSLSYSLAEEQAGWFSNNKSQPSWKIRSGTYCCFNAFSRVDMRVEVQIPGGVVSYLVDLKGDRHPITNNTLWQETYISGILRAIMDDNDEPDGNDGNQLRGLRKLDAIKSLEAEQRFLEAAYSEFWKSWQLGTEPEVQVATYVSNHLSNGIMKYFGDSYRYDIASEFFKNLAEKDPEVSVLLARSYIGYDEEIKAIEVLNEALKLKPQSYSLILVQIDFLRKKKRYDMALKLAKLAVTYAPSEFITWGTLAEVFFDMDDIEMALLTLNSCPMFTYCEKDSNCQRMPMPSRLNIAMNYDTKSSPEELKDIKDHINPTDSNGDFREHVQMDSLRLPATSLRGTFLKAYELLVKIVRKIGWNKLLYYRSSVFVMEEEYRVQRASLEKKQQEKNAERERTVSFSRTTENKIEEIAVKEHLESPAKVEEKEEDKKEDTEGKGKENAEEEGEGEDGLVDVDLENKLEEISLSSDAPAPKSVEEEKQEEQAEEPKEEKQELEKKNSVVIDNNGNDSVDDDDKALNEFSQYSFKDKRLCERWLDNLFMVLYEDLRFYTSFRDEMAHLKARESKHIAYRKTYMEWETFGDLALRLQHTDEAKEAYLYSFEQKYSSKSLLRLLDIYSNEYNIQGSLEIINRLVILYEFTFTNNIYPNPISRSIFKLVHYHGLVKVMNAALGLTNFELIQKYFDYAKKFKVEGYNL
ncbi:chaps-domain-containing protein [Piromyces finnis]|uniref:Chaps-domain-containing protein n=1 Tax=Piromyces finnis TaxID=1754191 RepID=A0A1Y1VDN4_9FUNG|nr:chaps-domain-containing protein [Piromyces finnis]|eukprot:ORX52991.1 chaps-domain-containing protein [Piromyces finnis]